MKTAHLIAATLAAAAFAPLLAIAQTVPPQSGSEWFAAVCGQQDLVMSAVKYVLAPIGGAAVLANLRHMLPAGLVSILDLIGANWVTILRTATTPHAAPPAAPGGTTTAALIAVLLGGLGLAACTAGGSGTDVSTNIQTATNDLAAGIQAACTDVMAASKLPGVDPNVGVYATAACATAGAVGALAQNSQTLQWLGKVQGQLQASAAAAPAAPASAAPVAPVAPAAVAPAPAAPTPAAAPAPAAG